jgi:hypothetical protein
MIANRVFSFFKTFAIMTATAYWIGFKVNFQINEIVLFDSKSRVGVTINIDWFQIMFG